jgi:hypothetical protein
MLRLGRKPGAVIRQVAYAIVSGIEPVHDGRVIPLSSGSATPTAG